MIFGPVHTYIDNIRSTKMFVDWITVPRRARSYIKVETRSLQESKSEQQLTSFFVSYWLTQKDHEERAGKTKEEEKYMQKKHIFHIRLVISELVVEQL